MKRLKVEIAEPIHDGDVRRGARKSTRYVKNIDAWLDRQARELTPGSYVTIHKGTGGTWQLMLGGLLTGIGGWITLRETFGMEVNS